MRHSSLAPSVPAPARVSPRRRRLRRSSRCAPSYHLPQLVGELRFKADARAERALLRLGSDQALSVEDPPSRATIWRILRDSRGATAFSMILSLIIAGVMGSAVIYLLDRHRSAPAPRDYGCLGGRRRTGSRPRHKRRDRRVPRPLPRGMGRGDAVLSCARRAHRRLSRCSSALAQLRSAPSCSWSSATPRRAAARPPSCSRLLARPQPAPSPRRSDQRHA
jgi:hypothetical protein